MSEEHVEDVIEGMLRQSLAAGSQLAEQVARARQQYLRNVAQQAEQATVEAHRTLASDRAVMQSAIVPAMRDDWWKTAQPEQITQAYVLAEAWKDYDPAALAASAKISQEVKDRYGIEMADMQGDSAYLHDNLAMQQFTEGTLKSPSKAAHPDTPKFYVYEFINESDKSREISKEAALALIESTPADQKKKGGRGAVDDIQGFVGTDAEVDRAITEKFPDLLISDEQRRATWRKAVKEYEEAMALVEAAQSEKINHRAAALQDELERHHVPSEYLASAEMVSALQASQEAVGTDVAADADRAVAERMYLIEQDGINGPSIDDLRQEIGQNYSGTDDSMFADAGFVDTARDWHEAKTLAEAGFVDKGNTGLEARYENAEQELFARIAPMGQEIRDKVLKDSTTKTPAPAAKAEKPSGPAYGSKEHYAAFETSLQGTATDAQIKGRVAAAKGQATPPRAAVEVPKKTPKARKASAGASIDRERSQSGPSR